MQSTIIDKPSFFVDQKSAIEQLLQVSPTQPFFLQPAYLAAWWQHEGRGELKIIAFHEGEKLVGLLPLYLQDNQLRLVGAVDLSDYLDFIYDPQYQESIFTELINVLQTKIEWSELRLESLPESEHLNALSAIFKKSGWQVEQKLQTVAPVITLPTNPETWWNELEPSAAKNFKRLLKTIGVDDEISYRLVSNPAEMPSAVTTFITLHKQSGSDKEQFWTPAREQLFQELVLRLSEAGLIKIYFLDVNNDPAAALFIFDYHNQFLLYNSGFNAYRYGYLGVGNALVLHTINEAIQLGKTRYDFMRGNESYKYLFGAKDENIFDMIVTKPT